MKNLFTTCLIFFSLLNLNAQSCLSLGITFSTQQEINNFQISYPNCTEIEGDVSISGNDIIDLAGLSQIQSILGSLEITENYDLITLSGLDNLTHIGGKLKIVNNDIVSLNGLNNLEYIGSSLEINRNDNLISLMGLEGLVVIDGLSSEIERNDNLESFQGLENLSKVKGLLNIVDNQSLTSISLNSLDTIGLLSILLNESLVEINTFNDGIFMGGLYLIDNNELNNLDAFHSVQRIENEVIIKNNDALSSLDGLHNLEFIGGNFRLEENDGLSSLSGLEDLETIDGDLKIKSNSGLNSLTGLENLRSVWSNIFIEESHGLTSLDGLDSLREILGLRLKNNDNINSLYGVENIDTTFLIAIGLDNCSNLSICSVQPICDYLENGGLHSVGGNATGCENVTEILNACQGLSSQDVVQNKLASIQLFPNPTNGYLSIQGIEFHNLKATIFNLFGKNILSLKVENSLDIDLSSIPSGVYFIEFSDDKNSITKKIIKE